MLSNDSLASGKSRRAFAIGMTDMVSAAFELVWALHPAGLPDIAINMFWHAKFHKDPANQWLRGLVFQLHAS